MVDDDGFFLQLVGDVRDQQSEKHQSEGSNDSCFENDSNFVKQNFEIRRRFTQFFAN